VVFTLPDRLRGLTGARRALVAVLLGVLVTAALPPVTVLPLAVIGFTGLIWLLDGAQRRITAIGIGWWFGVGHSATAYYWIANSLLVDIARYGWLYPPAMATIAAGFALFPALVAGIAWTWRPGVARIVAFGTAWVGVEWLRSWIFTGFPWNLMGTALDLDVRLLQPAAFAGVFGLSAIVMAVCLAPAIAGYAAPGRGLRRAAFACLAGLLAIVLVGAYGACRLGSAEVAPDPASPMIRLVQPNIQQNLKWRPDLQDSQIATHIAESRLQNGTDPRVVVWPESAIPYQFFRDPDIRREIAAAVPPGGLLIAGTVRGERGADGEPRYFNSLVALDETGEVVAVYDKQHLVPFGEYVPLRGILPIDKLTPGTTDFSAGPGPRTIDLPDLPPFSPLVCYEAIFPAEAVDPDRRPAWLLNITNDAWFGVSSGPYQHLAAARLRAVEQGLPLLRAANTGISAVIDAQGRYIDRLGLNRQGVIDAPLPPPMAPTIYSRWGNWTLLLITFPALAYLAWTLLVLPPRGDSSASAATRPS
jgi:apolipoprotein N-acyltransferase